MKILKLPVSDATERISWIMEKSRTKYSIINIGVGFAGYFINTILGFVCRIVFVRCLPTEYLGISGLFSNILSMLSLAEMGIGTAIGYALYKPLAEHDEEKVASLMRFYGSAYRIIGCVVAVIGLLLLPFLHLIIGETPDIKENIYWIYVVYLFNTCLTYFFSYRASLLVADQRNYIQLGISYLITTIQSGVQMIVLHYTHEYGFYLAIQTIGTFSFNIAISWKATHDYPYIEKKDVKSLNTEEKKSLFINIRALLVEKLSTVLVTSTDNIIISYFSGLISVGLSSNYSLFTSTLSTLTSQIFNSMTASIGNLNALSEKKDQYRFFKILQMANFYIYGWATIGILFVISDLVELFYGKSMVLSAWLPFAYALSFYVGTMNTSVTTYRSTLGIFRYGQYTTFFTAILNLALSIIWGKWWGLFGIIFATAVARLLTNAWYIPYVVFKHGFNMNPLMYYLEYVKYFFILVVEGVACYLICSRVHFSIAIKVILKILICSVISNVGFIACFGRTYEFNYLMEKLKQGIGSVYKRIRH
jgi:O-antigen/teichoic acid export membrane protein